MLVISLTYISFLHAYVTNNTVKIKIKYFGDNVAYTNDKFNNSRCRTMIHELLTIWNYICNEEWSRVVKY